MEERWSQEEQNRRSTDWSSEEGVNAVGQALCCSLGLGVYGNGGKHDISPAVSGTTLASNDSPAAQWVVKLQPTELLPSPTTTSRYQPGSLVLTRRPGWGREEDVSSQQLTEKYIQNCNWPQKCHQLGKGYNLMLLWMPANWLSMAPNTVFFYLCESQTWGANSGLFQDFL